MNQGQQKTAFIRVRFSARAPARSAFEDWGRDQAVSVNVLRGRITQKDPSFEIAVTGPTRRIQDFMQRGDTWGASIGVLSMGVA